MAKIKNIFARQILNASAMPTIETTIVLDDGMIGIAAVPSGIATGSYEAYELRDHDDPHYNGLGVQKAIQNITDVIGPKIIGMDVTKQQLIDRTMIELDGTQNKNRLGGNAILSVSIAVAKAAAQTSRLPLYLYLRGLNSRSAAPLHIPTPLFTMVSGGAHADNGLNFQEFLLTTAGSIPFSQALEWGVAVAQQMKQILRGNSFPTSVENDGGFSPKSANNTDALTLLMQAITQSNLRLGLDLFLGINAAANGFHSTGQYKIADKESQQSTKDMVNYYETLLRNSAIIYLEDPFAENDWEGWQQITSLLGTKSLIVGNDLTATNIYRLQMVLDKRAANGIVVQPTQVGTVIESLAVVEVARAAGLKVIVAERNHETNDDFIADFAVAAGADYCKFGGPFRGEHVVKYNKLLHIEEQIKKLK